MTVYIVQKLHWEYQDLFYEVDNDLPVKAFLSRHDAEEFRKQLESQARQHWEQHDASWRAMKHPDRQALTPQEKFVRDQKFYRVVEVEYEP